MNFFEDSKIIFALAKVVFKKDYSFATNTPRRILEEKLAEFLGVRSVLGVSSGTDAIMIALHACGVKPEDEVIVPTVGFVSTASAVTWIGARPVFVDVEKKTMLLDPAKIEQVITPRTKALIVTHTNGSVGRLEEIQGICGKYGIYLIEDAAQAFGSTYKGSAPGFYGDIVCFSFNPTKILATYGDGGAVGTNNEVLAEKMSIMRTYGAHFKELGQNHITVGIASRLGALQAAVLNVKIEKVDKVIERRRENYYFYEKLLAGIGDLEFTNPVDGLGINGYRFVLFTEKALALYQFLRDHRVEATRNYSVPIPYHKVFSYLGYQEGDFPQAEWIAKNSIVLPTGPDMRSEKIISACESVKKFFG